MKPTIVLTGIEQHRSFVRFQALEDLKHNKDSFRPQGPVQNTLVFNDGDLRVPVDNATFKIIVDYLLTDGVPESPHFTKASVEDLPPGAEVFGGGNEEVIPPPPVEEEQEEDEWTGAEDDGDDGVGQL